MGKEAPNPTEDANVVRLRGRVAAEPEVRILPSGDEIATWRLIVPRPAREIRIRADGRKGIGIDTFDCAAWRPALRKQVRTWQQDDVVEVDGSLHRRFYRQAGNLVSRHEVIARRVRRVTRAEEQGVRS